MNHRLDAPLAPLVRDYRTLQAQGDALVLATILSTAGSTYRKTGAQMLITAQGEPRGLLSGGCLEADLVEHAREALATGRSRIASYDMRGEDDLLFGIGSGCEGSMEVLLQRVGPTELWQPLARIGECVDARIAETIGLIADGVAAGRSWWTGGGDAPWPEPDSVRNLRIKLAVAPQAGLIECRLAEATTRVLLLPLVLPPKLLLCGAGADVVPLARLAISIGLAVTVCDHRPALAIPERFPDCEVHCMVPSALAAELQAGAFDLAVVMSHYLPADLEYLRALAGRPDIAYVGLLGPAPRRERLLKSLGPVAVALQGRLHAPVGLDIGARTPDAIALAIAAELYAWLAYGSHHS